MSSRQFVIALWVSTFIVWSGCSKDDLRADELIKDKKIGPTPYFLKIPPGFPDYFLEEENRLTEEGVELGRFLFYDPILSRNRNVSCGTCHQQQFAFSDPLDRSIGTHGEETNFHSMPLFNIAWMDQFFWNGRAFTREDQALKPVVNAIEMDLTWPEAVLRLQEHELYPSLFEKAFGSRTIDSILVAKAIVQFEMTIVSSETKFDRWLRGKVEFSALEEEGYQIFTDLNQGDCIHCHMIQNVHLSDNGFHNNGLDTESEMSPGLMEVTKRPEDCGKFKTPSLRNLAFTAPYMHDGRFKTLRDVVRFYSYEVNDYDCVDPMMEFAHQGGVGLDSNRGDFDALIAFLITLTDSNLLKNPAYSDPFKN